MLVYLFFYKKSCTENRYERLFCHTYCKINKRKDFSYVFSNCYYGTGETLLSFSLFVLEIVGLLIVCLIDYKKDTITLYPDDANKSMKIIVR